MGIDDEFSWNEEDQIHTLDLKTFLWWSSRTDEQACLDERIYRLGFVYGQDNVEDVAISNGWLDFNTAFCAIHAALDAAFGSLN